VLRTALQLERNRRGYVVASEIVGAGERPAWRLERLSGPHPARAPGWYLTRRPHGGTRAFVPERLLDAEALALELAPVIGHEAGRELAAPFFDPEPWLQHVLSGRI
jgi:hypothetical protein